MSNVATIVRFTLQEAVSRRLILAGLFLSLAFVGLFGWGAHLLQQDAPTGGGAVESLAGTLMTIMGMYAVSFLSGFLALFAAVGSISGEIESGTAHAVLARPLRRAEFVVGRWLAYLLLVPAYVALMAGVLLLLTRLITGFTPPDTVRPVALLVLQATVLLSITLLGSTLLPTLANGVVAFSLFGVAWMAGIIQVIGEILRNESMLNLATAVSLLVPSDALWRAASYYLQPPTLLAASRSFDAPPFLSGTPPTLPFVIWSLAHPLVLLAVATWTFSRRDL